MSSLPPPPPPGMTPPPGYVAYGTPGAYGRNFSPIKGLTTWLVALLAISLAVTVVTLIAQFAIRSDAEDFVNDRLSSSEWDDRLGLFLLAALVAVVASIALIVIQIIWTFRLAKNLRELSRQGQAFSPGATIAVNILGGCTLGILNYFMWREIWKGSDPDCPPGDGNWKQRPIAGIVHLWFGLSIAAIAASASLGFNNALGGIGGAGDADDIAEQLSDSIGVVLLSGALSVAASAVFIVLVRQLAARHMRATGET